MAIWYLVSRDLKIDADYGDFELVNSDIKLSQKSIDILYDTVIERYKTNLNDFALNPDYGADIERFIGSGIDKVLCDNIIASLRYSLTYDNFIDSNSLEIIPIILDHTIRLFTYIQTNGTTLEINATFDNTGVFKID